MYIHDVIGEIRATQLDLQKQIHALRLSLQMLEWEVAGRPRRSATPDVSRETEEGEGNGSYSEQRLF